MSAGRRLNKRGARRRMRTSAALFLSLYALACALLLGLLGGLSGMGGGAWFGALSSLLAFALPAWLGLFVLDGDHREILPARRLSGAQAMWLAASGALLVFVMALLSDLIAALPARFGFPVSAARAALEVGGFVPALLTSGLIAPVCEEVFFRGYLMGAFARYGRREAAVFSSLLFACCHGISLQTPVYLAMGLLLAAVCQHTQSLGGALVMHAAYNITLVVMAYSGLGSLITAFSPLGALLCLLGCAAAYYTMLRAWRARGVRSVETVSLSISRRMAVLAILALLLVAVAQVTSGVFAA